MSSHFSYWVPIITAAEGDFTTGEIQCGYKPSSLSPSQSTTLKQYISGFLVRSYRREWSPIDNVAERPESHAVDTGVKIPVIEHPLAPPLNPPTKSRMPGKSARMNGWELRVWCRYEGTAGPHIGFNIRPRLRCIDLYTRIYVILGRSLRDLDWFIGRKKVHGGWDRIDWRSTKVLGEEDVSLVLNEELLQLEFETTSRFHKTNAKPAKSTQNRVTSISVVSTRSDGSAYSESRRPTTTKKNPVEVRDRVCQFVGTGFPCNERTYGGRTTTHIVPFCQSRLLDRVRWAFDPAWKQGEGSDEAFTRINRWELDFDDFLIFVDVLRPQPSTSEVQNHSNRSNINRDHILQSHYGSDYLFPHLPLDPISLSAPDKIPAISHISLFLHARSCLLATCTTEGFTEMEDVETARSRWGGAAEPEPEWWETDVDEGDDWPGDEGSSGEGSVSRLEKDLDGGAESVLGSADSGNVEGPLEELLIDNSSDDFTASWVSQLQEEELLVPDEL